MTVKELASIMNPKSEIEVYVNSPSNIYTLWITIEDLSSDPQYQNCEVFGLDVNEDYNGIFFTLEIVKEE